MRSGPNHSAIPETRNLESFAHLATTSIPIERAVPSMVRMADSRSVQFMSLHLLTGELANLGFGHLADLVLVRLLGARARLLPVASPAAFLRRTLAGGVFSMNVNERSE